MEKYYVSGCRDDGEATVTCEDSEATFWTLYARDDKGLSHGIIDLAFREDVEAAMQVYIMRDAHFAAEMVWEKTMMETIGEDGVGSVKAAIERLQAERDALQEQVQKLAAENAALKDAFHPETVPDDLLDNFGDAVKMDGETFWEGDNCTSFSCVSNAEELIKLSIASMGGIETPATDAVIREIGAKAVDEFTEWCLDESASPGDNYHLAAEKAEKYAAKFREGEQP